MTRYRASGHPTPSHRRHWCTAAEISDLFSSKCLLFAEGACSAAVAAAVVAAVVHSCKCDVVCRAPLPAVQLLQHRDCLQAVHNKVGVALQARGGRRICNKDPETCTALQLCSSALFMQSRAVWRRLTWSCRQTAGTGTATRT